MAVRRAVVCAECGHPYAARLVDGDVILPTDDGRCVCGNDSFVLSPGESDADGEPAQ